MYNRYIPSTHLYRPATEKYTPFGGEEQEKKVAPSIGGWQRTSWSDGGVKGLRALISRDKSGSIRDLLGGLGLDRLDTGDVLLLLIVLLLLSEGDELDFVVILGLVLLLGLGGDKNNRHSGGGQPSECRSDTD